MKKTYQMTLATIALAMAVGWSGSIGAAPPNSSIGAAPSNSQRNGDRNFFVRLTGGEEVTIARNGPLELFARCSLFGPFTILDVRFTSSENGWFSRGAGPLTAGTEFFVGNTSSTGPRFTGNIDGNAAVSPSGHYMGVDREILGLGVNLFDSDCLVAGEVVTTREPGN